MVHNPSTLKEGIAMVFRRNWDIKADWEAEVDSSLTYRENFRILKRKYPRMGYNL